MAPEYSEAELDAAIAALEDPERFREAEAMVGAAAPKLARVLAQALESGGWFAESHDDAAAKAAGIDERRRAPHRGQNAARRGDPGGHAGWRRDRLGTCERVEIN